MMWLLDYFRRGDDGLTGRQRRRLARRHWRAIRAPFSPSERAALDRLDIERGATVTEGGYPCSVDGKRCPCGSWSEDCR